MQEMILNGTKAWGRKYIRSGDNSSFLVHPAESEGECLAVVLLQDGVRLAMLESRVVSWPLPAEIAQLENPLVLYICLDGRHLVARADGGAVVLAAGELCVSFAAGQPAFCSPAGKEQGVALFLDRKKHQAANSFFSLCGIRLSDLEQLCEANGLPIVRQAPEQTLKIAQALWMQRAAGRIGTLRLGTANLLQALLQSGAVPSGKASLTERQLMIAQAGEQLLCGDLAVRHSAKEIAARFGVSETGFKNYFRAVYGVPLFDYVQARRIERACALLTGTELDIAQIASCVGYENQSKFADAFNKKLEITPLKYRKSIAHSKHEKTKKPE